MKIEFQVPTTFTDKDFLFGSILLLIPLVQTLFAKVTFKISFASSSESFDLGLY